MVWNVLWLERAYGKLANPSGVCEHGVCEDVWGFIPALTARQGLCKRMSGFQNTEWFRSKEHHVPDSLSEGLGKPGSGEKRGESVSSRGHAGHLGGGCPDLMLSRDLSPGLRLRQNVRRERIAQLFAKQRVKPQALQQDRLQ